MKCNVFIDWSIVRPFLDWLRTDKRSFTNQIGWSTSSGEKLDSTLIDRAVQLDFSKENESIFFVTRASGNYWLGVFKWRHKRTDCWTDLRKQENWQNMRSWITLRDGELSKNRIAINGNDLEWVVSKSWPTKNQWKRPVGRHPRRNRRENLSENRRVNATVNLRCIAMGQRVVRADMTQAPITRRPLSWVQRAAKRVHRKNCGDRSKAAKSKQATCLRHVIARWQHRQHQEQEE